MASVGNTRSFWTRTGLCWENRELEKNIYIRREMCWNPSFRGKGGKKKTLGMCHSRECARFNCRPTQPRGCFVYKLRLLQRHSPLASTICVFISWFAWCIIIMTLALERLSQWICCCVESGMSGIHKKRVHHHCSFCFVHLNLDIAKTYRMNFHMVKNVDTGAGVILQLDINFGPIT